MDSNDWRQPEQSSTDGSGGDWRLQFQNDSRQRIVNDIMETLKLRKIAMRIEEKSYHAATSQSDYHSRIRLKILKMESYSAPPGTIPNAIPSNYAGMNDNPQDPASLDSTAHTDISESQEEFYQKIKAMKDLYYPEILEIHQKICSKLQQFESLSDQTKPDAVERLKYFKEMIGRILMCLQMSRSNAQYLNNDKVSGLEKQIVGVINSHRPPGPVLQQGQIPPFQSINEAQSHENGVNPLLQSVHVQGSSIPTVQSGDTSDING